MPPVRTSPPYRSRGTPLLGLFLLVTLVLSLWLGAQAVAAARSHRRTAEGVLSDYAGIAAWEYSRLARENLDYLYRWVFDDVPYSLRRRRPPHPDVMVPDMVRSTRSLGCECPGLRQRTRYFRIDLQDRSVVSEPDSLPPVWFAALTGLLVSRRDSFPEDRFGLLTAEAGVLQERPSVVVYVVTEDGEEEARLAYGFVADIEAFGELLSVWYEGATLLPTSIAGARPSRSLGRITVWGRGVPIFESPADYPGTFSAHDTLESEYGSLVVESAIRPDAASGLIIGGLPRSRLPLLLTLMLLTLGVGTAALLQIRREHQLAQLRDDFISGVSHEFRTPLTQIRLFAELLNGGKLKSEDERKRSVGVIDREARRLSHLVENILHFSRLSRAPSQQAESEDIDVREAVLEVVGAFTLQADAGGIRIETVMDRGVTVRAGREGLHRILANLVDNGLKYGGAGERLAVRATRSGDVVRISVEDQGPGIPARDRMRIWEPYRRLERDLTGGIQGSGIGLAVVSELCSLYGGSVWVEDAEASGSRFVVELPAGAGNRGDPQPRTGEE